MQARKTTVYIIIALALGLLVLACVPKPQTPTPPGQAGPTAQQLSQRLADLEKRLKAVEDASPAQAKAAADLRKELDEIKLRLNLVETRPLPSGLSPQEKAQLDDLERRVRSLEPTPIPRPTPTLTPTPRPTPTPTPVASAAALQSLEQQVNALDSRVQQLERRATPTLTPTPTPTPIKDVLIVSNTSDLLDNSRLNLTITGQVNNQGNREVTSITVVATLYRSDGTILGQAYVTPLLGSLQPGESSPFTMTITGLDFSRYRLGGYSLMVTTSKPAVITPTP